MLIALQARDKVCFINGDFMKPGQDDTYYKQWVKVNVTLISWMLNAMTKDLARGFAYASNDFSLWEEIRVKFGGCVGPRLYEIGPAIYLVKQEKDSVK
ncbi:hypothetical protein LIER_43130 [Lithospermum erythrorhizon]|uniref:Retrotransposon Copia-like N-terminal domain-containing protein n=1 Tax=Lithospermum erythrorhizon TaxID=34254 RepID=A0AAV3PHC5_LITER